MSNDVQAPRATYRLQFNETFRLPDALALVPYLRDLGISHLYASPLFKARPHSMHGYDVCDFTQLNPEIGSEEDLARLVTALHDNHLGLVLDIVPNHMGIGAPENYWWWDVLTHGASSQYASYFDIDWETADPRLRGKVPLPILEDRYGRVLEKGVLQVQLDHGRLVLRYHDNELPLAPATIPAGSDLPRLNASPEALDELIGRQNYFLTYWRHGDSRLKHRRFFTISSLIGLRVEDERVFNHSHSLIKRWLENGWLAGLRVDHPDGLRDPAQYLTRLRHLAPRAWITVEKILEPGEPLPPSWPVAGTTGYDFLNVLGGLFVDPAAEKPLTDFYAEFTGETTQYQRMVCDKKRAILEDSFIAEVNVLVELLIKIADRYWRYRDFTRGEFREALIETAGCLSVYRTYLTAESAAPAPEEAAALQDALDASRRRRPRLAPELFDFLGDLLLLRARGDLENEFVARFQQLSGPAMAKGVEDTAFYCFNRFIALNEVGGDPGAFGTSVEAFHKFCSDLQARWPATMLATSTHDTKRGEDVRARLAAISENAALWMDAVRRWSAINQSHRHGDWPDRNAEYVFYQTLVGAWPLSTERAVQFMIKAASEAKQFTNWTEPNEAYCAALRGFVTDAMQNREFMADVEKFVCKIVDHGMRNSLSQTLLKLTAPGAPDFYQGAELWDLSLVDPDNRRPVNFDCRRQWLAELDKLSLDDLWRRRAEGLPKLYLIRQVLRVRDRFSQAGYEPLNAGPAVAFRRGDALVIAPRLAGEGALELPPGNWHNILTGEKWGGGTVTLAQVLTRFPVALLLKENANI
ncbi:MAG TPA: malto-oligosyltrehalose synthase [Verrucomicrobiae bacterium]|jgi:(1->4)-alpha-D-glucan 1-alpha-D-glucosylmutase|nr:malto-oligosyltrehalose synthase [Verrucomicrobiae bacterium]